MKNNYDRTTVTVPIKDLEPLYNIRRDLEISDLSATLDEVGIIHLPVVVEIGKKLFVVSGWRRVKALEETGKNQIDVSVLKPPDSNVIKIGFRLTRCGNTSKPLSPIEKGTFIKEAIEKFGLDLEKDIVSEDQGWSKTNVYDCKSLLDLPIDIQNQIHHGSISFKAGVSLARLKKHLYGEYMVSKLAQKITNFEINNSEVAEMVKILTSSNIPEVLRESLLTDKAMTVKHAQLILESLSYDKAIKKAVKLTVKWELSLRELQELLENILRKNEPVLLDWSRWLKRVYSSAQKLGTSLDKPQSPKQENRQEVRELMGLLTDIIRKCEILNISLEEAMKN
jgi:ParB/RepB/Spo0J family partition protein